MGDGFGLYLTEKFIHLDTFSLDFFSFQLVYVNKKNEKRSTAVTVLIFILQNAFNFNMQT